jgi:hypothetical protein
LGAVDASLIFGLIRGTGTGSFTAVLPTFVLLPRMQLAQQYRVDDHFLRAVSSSRHEAMVGGTLTRSSVLSVGLGVSGATIVSGSCVRPSHSWISRLLTSSLSLGISSLFCRVTDLSYLYVVFVVLLSCRVVVIKTVYSVCLLPDPSILLCLPSNLHSLCHFFAHHDQHSHTVLTMIHLFLVVILRPLPYHGHLHLCHLLLHLTSQRVPNFGAYALLRISVETLTCALSTLLTAQHERNCAHVVLSAEWTGCSK